MFGIHDDVFKNLNLVSLINGFSRAFIMKLKDFSALCFDMDFTLVNYSLKNFLPMVYDVTAQFLVEKKGYPKSLQHRDEADVSFIFQFFKRYNQWLNVVAVANMAPLGGKKAP